MFFNKTLGFNPFRDHAFLDPHASEKIAQIFAFDKVILKCNCFD